MRGIRFLAHRSSPQARSGRSNRTLARSMRWTRPPAVSSTRPAWAQRSTSAPPPRPKASSSSLPAQTWSLFPRASRARSRPSSAPCSALDRSEQVGHLDRRLGGLGALIVLWTGAGQRLLLILRGQDAERDRHPRVELHLHDAGRRLSGNQLEVIGLAPYHASQADDRVVAALLRERQHRNRELERAWHPVDVGVFNAMLFERR